MSARQQGSGLRTGLGALTRSWPTSIKFYRLAGRLAVFMGTFAACGYALPEESPPAAAAAESASVTADPVAPSPLYHPNRFAGRAGTFYRLVWGVDSLRVKLVESGELIRFSYRVLDPDKAKALNDAKSTPELIDPQVGVSLQVPSMEQVGSLRQTSLAVAGKSYWMTFSNKGRRVRPGDRVTVAIGSFRAEGLVVDP